MAIRCVVYSHDLDMFGLSPKRVRELEKHTRRDYGVATAFVGAIAVLLLIAGYVISRLSSERAHREKWKDYNDCGWA